MQEPSSVLSPGQDRVQSLIVVAVLLAVLSTTLATLWPGLAG